MAQSDSLRAPQRPEGKGFDFGICYPLSTHGLRAGEYTNAFSLMGTVKVSRAERGVSVAGVTAIIREDARGWQLAGVSNHVGKSVRGATVAGVLNTYQSGEGFQLAGFANLSRGPQRGLQLAAFLNKAGQVTGLQAAGFLNRATTVRGAQLGIINLAERNDYPIGIINLVKGGEKSLGISTDETLTTLVSFRSGGRVMYGVLGIGYNLTASVDHYALEAGVGAHLVDRRLFRLNGELVSISMTNFREGESERYAFRLLPALRLADRLEVFAGPTFNYARTDAETDRKLSTRDVWRRAGSGYTRELYLGLTGGLHLMLN